LEYHSSVLLTSSALLLGCLHGLGADHLMAIAALSVGPRQGEPRQHPVRVAVAFAVGHAVLLAAGAALVVTLGWQIPALVERTGEVVGGVLLIALGAFALWVAAGRRLYGHSHAHGDPPRAHWHLHFGHPSRHPAPAGHSHVPGILGAVFAVSGLRALTMMVPFGDAASGVAASALALLYFVGVFAVGILISMSLFGIVLSRVLGSVWLAHHVGRGAAVVTAVASIALGVYWIGS
jgi:nickel/cobalt exporter